MLMQELEGGAELLVLSQGSGALVEGAGDANDTANLALLIVERLLGGGGPIDESITPWHELDPVDDGLAGF